MAENLDSAFQQVESTLTRRLLDGVLLLPVGGDEPIYVTKPGDALWTLLEVPMTLNELAETLSSAFGASVDRVLADVEPILRSLAEAGAVFMTDALS